MEEEAGVVEELEVPDVVEAPETPAAPAATAEERAQQRLEAALAADEVQEDPEAMEGEEAAEEPAEALSGEPEEGEELESEKLAHLRSQMREIANGQQQLKEERHAFNQQQQQYKAEIDEMRQTMTGAAEMARDNPAELFRRLGVDYWKQIEDTLGDGASDPQTRQTQAPPIDPNQLMQQMSSMMEEKLNGFADSQKKEQQRRRFDQRIYGAVADSEKYPEMTKQADKSVELVRSAILDHFNKTGERLTPEDVAPHVETYLFNKRATLITEARKDTRYSEYFGSSGETQEQAPAPKAVKRAPTPMVNELTTESSVPPGPRTKEERLAAAVAMAVEGDIKF